jgi:hypothetical protein
MRHHFFFRGAVPKLLNQAIKGASAKRQLVKETKRPKKSVFVTCSVSHPCCRVRKLLAVGHQLLAGKKPKTGPAQADLRQDVENEDLCELTSQHSARTWVGSSQSLSIGPWPNQIHPGSPGSLSSGKLQGFYHGGH